MGFSGSRYVATDEVRQALYNVIKAVIFVMNVMDSVMDLSVFDRLVLVGKVRLWLSGPLLVNVSGKQITGFTYYCGDE